MRDFLGLAGKRAIVVGGGFGMGRAAAVALSEVGCDLAIVDLDPLRSEAVAQELRGRGRNAISLTCDILDPEAAAKAIGDAAAALEGLDVLVTVVGQAGWNRAVDVTPQQWDHDLNLNLRYVFFCAQAFARHAVRAVTGGSITCISSVSGVQSSPFAAPYGAAKAGLVNLVKSLACEFADYGVRINAIAPGVIETPRVAASHDYATYRAKIATSPIPLRRPGEISEIASAVLFMSSDMASYVSGQTLCVDGGWMAQNLVAGPLDLATNLPENRAGDS